MKANNTTAWVAMTLALCIVGCRGKSKPAPSTKPPPAKTAAQLVDLYETPPHRYERLGEISVPVGDVKWDASANGNAGFDRLKEKAALLGANGVLLHVDSSARDGTALAGYHGIYYEVSYMNTTPRIFIAQAIYVVEK
jgi:hypothetical protein